MSELEELKRLGAIPQPNSGRGKHNKGDGILDDRWIVDVKEASKSFTLNTNVWGKVCTDAAQSNKEPLLLAVFGEEGKPRTRLIIMSADEFEELRSAAAAYSEMQDAGPQKEWLV